VILSVLDPRKCEYLKDDSLDFEHAYMTTYLASMRSMSILEEMLEMFIYTGCPRRNVPDLGSVFLMLKYTDITQNTYIQS